MNLLIIYNIIITSFMMGLILTTQIVSYPLFRFVSNKNFLDYHLRYVSKISFIVVPIMLIEFLLSLFLFISFSDFLFTFLLFVNILILLSTYYIQVPLHNFLSKTHNKQKISRLIKSNWLRTFLWAIKLYLSLLIVLKENVV